MGEITGISWTDHTANFWLGCQRVSPGCEHCYAETLVVGRMRLPLWGPPSTTPRTRTKGAWKEVPKWDRAAKRDGVRRRLFCSSLSDIFEDHPLVGPWRDEALALLARCTNLDVQLLTKRPENVLRMVPKAWLEPGGWPAHIWVGTTIEDQKRADTRISILKAIPAKVRFLSMEPLLERVDIRNGPTNKWSVPTRFDSSGNGIEWTDPGAGFIPVEWVIVGGESGPKARPFDLGWANDIEAQCEVAGVPFFMKQVGDNPILTPGPLTYPTTAHHGADPNEWPENLRVREFPA